MLSVLLPPDIERRLFTLAKQTGRSAGEVARVLIEYNLEDMEDCCLAELAIAEGGARLTGEDVRKELGLAA